MRKQSIAVCLFAIVAIFTLAAPSAKADSVFTFKFNYSGSGLNETSIITTTNTLNASGAYTILAVVGQINGVSFTGLSSFASADQFLFPSGPFIDFAGVSFAGANGINYTVGAFNGLVYAANSVTDPSGVFVSNEPVKLTVSRVPEPGSLGLIALGLLALGMRMFRSRRIRTVTSCCH
jgi:hypothetical protein